MLLGSDSKAGAPGRRRTVASLALVLHACGGGSTAASLDLSADTREALARRPAELTLADGRLRVFNLYKHQATIVADTAPLSRRERIDQLVNTVYRPHAAFWNGYLGDEADFRKWTDALFDPEHPFATTLPALVRVNLDSLFEVTADWVHTTTGLHPEGDWYLVYGPGWTNMGGLGEIGMVADFSKQEIDSRRLASILSHELTHQVHGRRAADPDGGTVLERIVSEGVASYAQYVFGGGVTSPARSLGYDDGEYAWAIAHEAELQKAANAILNSRERSDLDRVAARREVLVADGPGAAGYFLGFRVAAAFAERHGSGRWPELLRMPVREAVRASGYPLAVDR